MSSTNEVFVTGLGALTACGLTADATWQAIMGGESGLDEISQWDLSSWSHRLGGELKNFQPASSLPDRKLWKVISHQDAIGINAAMQAISHSQLINYRDTLACANAFNESTAIYVGSPGNKYFQQYDFLPLLAKTNGDMQAFAEQLFAEVHPMWLLRILPNNVLAYVGITYNFKGPNHNITNHAVSGMQAIIEAYHAIQQGEVQRAVVVAYDVAIEPQALFYYEKLGVLSAHHLKPFDKAHDGTILAEGAAAFVLESKESAEARAATCYAKIVGGLSATEACGLFSIEDEGTSLATLMTRTLEQSQITPGQIGFITAHGNGNKKSDNSEAQAIKQVFGAHSPPINAFKWATGHTICASGILDTLLSIYALGENCIPGVAHFDQLATACAGLNISQTHRQGINAPYGFIINRGFASMNACLVIKACD